MKVYTDKKSSDIIRYSFYYINKQGEVEEVKFSTVEKEIKKRILKAQIAIGIAAGVTFLEDIITAGAGIADDLQSILIAVRASK